MKHALFIVYSLLVLTACQARTASATGEQASRDSSAQAGFPFPEIPSVLTTPEARKAYLLTHYWERFDFADTALVNNPDITEQGFVDFIALLADGTTSDALAGESMENWCGGFLPQRHARRILTRLADDYLQNPASPFYNEALYATYLKAMLVKLPADDMQGSTYTFRLELLSRNCVGAEASDFAYYLPDGSRRTLHTTTVKGDYLLLVFYDPECVSCHETLLQMQADPVFAGAVAQGKASVLAVYTEGDNEVWQASWADLPKKWTTGTDRGTIRAKALYNLRAMPSLYLLDRDKRVVLKDAPFDKIRHKL